MEASPAALGGSYEQPPGSKKVNAADSSERVGSPTSTIPLDKVCERISADTRTTNRRFDELPIFATTTIDEC
jgi:hypothetical protein